MAHFIHRGANPIEFLRRQARPLSQVRPLSAATLAATLALGALSFAQPAHAGESDVTWNLYKMRVQECTQRAPAGPTVHGCGGAATGVETRAAAPVPSNAALPARLRQAHRPTLQ